MDLHTGKMYWPTTLPDAPAYPTLREDVACDVLVIGGGSSGAQCAYELSGAGLDVVVADKRRVGWGSTLTNTALLQYLGDKMLFELVNSFGEQAAIRHAERCRQAIADIEADAAALPRDVEFSRRDSLYCAASEADLPKLEQEFGYLSKHGFDAEWWSGDRIRRHYPFSRPAAIYVRNDGEINPFAYNVALIEGAKARGAAIYEQTEITGRVDEADHVAFRTAGGPTIRARRAIVAAGYETMSFKPDKNALLLSTYAVVTKPLDAFDGWHGRTLVWETARPYIYLRTTRDRRVIVGGLDEGTAIAEDRDSHLAGKRDRLMKELADRFPAIAAATEAEFHLAAFYGGTHDGLPMIGEYADFPRCFFLYAYGDNGLVYSSILAKLLKDRLTGTPNPAYEFYRQGRPALTR
ncbi:FAD-binding oxidoreductase [Paenibacillus sp. MWE-103]|uniref:FAD-binding oxidoreductase n=1 Tax=Paenibacillus artemisiicola TaxID=1172618 RepID=A0ABS3WJS8_9BACL|nr:FAD-dependent oxidoreductase [Paenibacillus artemisiicola]MBO7748375.1 FAD-binding oxidoreductase [Paenibacillus artemisiicola]